MATTSFEKKFSVSKENIDTFVRVINDPSDSNYAPKERFVSRAISNEELRRHFEKQNK